MECLDGCTPSGILAEEKRLPVSWTVDIIEQVSSALDEAHRHGIVHRDLKPDNVWLVAAANAYTSRIASGPLAEPSSRSPARG